MEFSGFAPVVPASQTTVLLKQVRSKFLPSISKRKIFRPHPVPDLSDKR